MLRKASQEILNRFDLDDYHAAIDNNKHMAVVGPCGKPLFHIYGITFNRASPTGAEIEYAVELLNEFLVKHRQTIKDYFKAIDKFMNMPIAGKEFPEFDFYADVPTQYKKNQGEQNSYRVHLTNEYGDSISLQLPKDKWKYNSSGYGKPALVELVNTRGLMPKMTKALTMFLKRHEAEEHMNSLLQKLQTCEI
jgi:hypothetical protein